MEYMTIDQNSNTSTRKALNHECTVFGDGGRGNETSEVDNSTDADGKLHIMNDKISHGEKTTEEENILAEYYSLQCKDCEDHPIFGKHEAFVKHCQMEHERASESNCCGFSLRDEQALVNHMNKQKPSDSFPERQTTADDARPSSDVEPGFSCALCSKRFNSKYSLAYHTNLHLPEAQRPYRCRHCDKGFATKQATAKHERTHLPDAERLSYVCDICGKRFGYASTLDGHQKHVHNRERPFACPVCAKTFPIKGALTYHLTTHQVQDRVQCAHCGIRLKNEKILQIHKKSHEGEVHKCPHCDKVSSTRNNLRMHMKRHSNERPYPCPLCTRAFKTSRDLKTHTVQHTGLKPYCCPFCPKTFASPSNFYAHRKMKHQASSQRQEPPATERQ